MRRAYFVTVANLKALYGETIKGVNNWEGGNRSVNLTLAGDKLEINKINTQGPYSLVRIVHSDDYNGFIVPTTIITDEEVPDAIDLFAPILDKYHKDCWWFNKNDSFLYIKYPELTLKNSLNLTHTVYDLVIRMQFDYRTGRFFASPFEGMRFSYTEPELRRGYIHSHLPSKHYAFYSFCQGTNTPFAQYLVGMQKVLSLEEFELLLTQVKQYLEWESIEGRPHIMIEGFYREESLDGAGGAVYDYDGDAEAILGITRFLLAQLVNNMSLVTKSGDLLLFDPSLDQQAFYKLERQFTGMFEEIASEHIFDYDEATQTYVKVYEEGRTEFLPHSVQFDYPGLYTGLNIQPKIIPTEKKKTRTTVTVKRFSKNFLNEVVNSVNNALLSGLNEIETDAAGIPIAEEGSRSTDTNVVSTDPVFA